MVLNEKFFQQYPVNAGVSWGVILGPTFFLLYINDLPDYVSIILLSKPTRNCRLGQEKAYFNAGNKLVSFAWSNNSDVIDVKMDRSVLEEKSSLKMLGPSFFSKLGWCSYIVCSAKTASKIMESLICSMKFLSPKVALYLHKSTIWSWIQYCCHVWAGACCYFWIY